MRGAIARVVENLEKVGDKELAEKARAELEELQEKADLYDKSACPALLTREESVAAYGRIPQSFSRVGWAISNSPTDHERDCQDVARAQLNKCVTLLLRVQMPELPHEAHPMFTAGKMEGFTTGVRAAITTLIGRKYR